MWWAARSVDRGDVGRTDNAGRIMLGRHECVCATCVPQCLVRRSCNCLRERYLVLRMLRASVLERKPVRRAARNWRRGGVGRTDNAGRVTLRRATHVRATCMLRCPSQPPLDNRHTDCTVLRVLRANVLGQRTVRRAARDGN